MKFLNMDHQSRFHKIKDFLPVNLRRDPEGLSVVYLIAGNKELEKKITPYMAWENGFDFNEMFEKEDFSSELKVLAKLAVVLYNNSVELNLIDLYRYLDEENLELAINAANFCFGHKQKGIYEASDSSSYLK